MEISYPRGAYNMTMGEKKYTEVVRSHGDKEMLRVCKESVYSKIGDPRLASCKIER